MLSQLVWKHRGLRATQSRTDKHGAYGGKRRSSPTSPLRRETPPHPVPPKAGTGQSPLPPTDSMDFHESVQ
jgi:hypothetical protein